MGDCKEKRRYCDPEIVSLLLAAVGPLGLVCSIIGTAISLVAWKNSEAERQRDSMQNKERKTSIEREIRATLRSLDQSVYAIKVALRDLREIYRISEKIADKQSFKFGNGSMWLSGFQTDSFFRIQTRITAEAQKINSDMKIIEELLLSGENYHLITDVGSNIRSMSYVEEATAPVNHLLSGFSHTSISEFTKDAIWLCDHTEETIRQLEDCLRRNY